MFNKKPDIKWESLCHRCGKCCHAKYDLLVLVVADPEYTCKYLMDDNTCSVYHDRFDIKGCNCIPLQKAVKKSGLLPPDCVYIHVNPKHKAIIFPSSVEEFWKTVEQAESCLRFMTLNPTLNLRSFIFERRRNMKGFKHILKTG